jgi:methylenetetrahydrofolate dehydrogenase (NADP+)/methenyltetrahydrofolate cyclohydrolase
MVFCCVGQPGLIKPKDVKENAIIVDVGITRLDDGKIRGDAGPTDIWANTDVALTPVPGGVGPMTVTMLMAHTCTSWKRWHD